MDELYSMENINTIEKSILIYVSAWNEWEPDAIREKIDQCWAPRGTYADKRNETVSGTDALTDLILRSHESMGQRTMEISGPPEIHFKKGRFYWLAIRPDDYPILGMDYFEFDDKNLITRIVGFF